jgi:hypothetical protein
MSNQLEKHIQVETYSLYKADERPVRVAIDGQTVEIAEVEDRWYSPGSTFFRVRLATGERYVLRRVEAQDVWLLRRVPIGRAPHVIIDNRSTPRIVKSPIGIPCVLRALSRAHR